MDLQSQVAARRAELEKKAREDQAVAAQQVQAREAAELARRDAALDSIAEELSGGPMKVARQGHELVVVDEPIEPLDVDGLRINQIKKLLNREARKMWTPAQNWQVIAPMVAGLCLLPIIWIFSAPLFIFSGIRRDLLNKRYKNALMQRYPELFTNI